MQSPSDEHLMQQYAAGDMEAFKQLYARYRGPLYRYFRRQVSEEATANDLYQGCWEKVIGARRRYRPESPFQAWVFRIAHNHLVDHLRRQRPAAPLEQAGYIGTPGDPGETLDQERRHSALRAAILALPEEQRDALLLKLEAGLGLREIATITGVGRETLKSRLRYATARLKQVLTS